jgi:putative colanic acid biosynthesis acetyltransferase WcaF
MKTDLSTYDNSWFYPGAGILKRMLWHLTNALFFINPVNASSGLKVLLLKLFGCRIGRGVNIKTGVNIKYPWLLEVGENSWIGEDVWIDNLVHVKLGANVCLSQGAMLLTGNHDYKKPTFDLIIKGIVLEDGVWIGAKAVVCPGVVCKSHSILSVGSVAVSDMDAYMVYQGNPAVIKRVRAIDGALPSPVNEI